MQMILLLFIAAWIIAASFARYSENKRVKALAQPALKSYEEMMRTLLKTIEDIRISQSNSEKLFEALLVEEPLPVPEATRVYAAILRKEEKMRLQMLPATSIEEFQDRTEAIIGRGWKASVVEYLDVVGTREKEPDKKMGIRQGLHFLQLVQDRFAVGTQKKTVERIIENYKKAYELA